MSQGKLRRLMSEASGTHHNTRLFHGMVHAFTLTKVIYQPEFAPQFTLLDPSHIGGFILM